MKPCDCNEYVRGKSYHWLVCAATETVEVDWTSPMANDKNLLYVSGAYGQDRPMFLCPSCRDELQSLGYLEKARVSLAGQWGDHCELCPEEP